MANIVINNLYVRGSKKELYSFFNSVLGNNEISKSLKPKRFLEEVNKANLSLSSWIPMPEIFREYDTTNIPVSYLSFATREYIGDNAKKVCEKYLGTSEEDKDNIKILNDACENMYGKDGKAWCTFAQKEELIMKLCPQYKEVYEKYLKDWKKACKEQKELCGCVGWREFALKYWGTKWDCELSNWMVYLDKVGDDIIFNCVIESAWSAPDMFLFTLTKMYPNLKFYMFSTDEFDEWAEYYFTQDGDLKTATIENTENELDEDDEDFDFDDEDLDSEIWCERVGDFNAELYEIMTKVDKPVGV